MRRIEPSNQEVADELPTSPRRQLSRRTVLAGAAALAFARVDGIGAVTAGRTRRVGMPPIVPRSDWDDGTGPTGPLEAEDVKFLLVHHTAEPGNNYEADDVVPLLQSIYRYHTSEAKGWPDIAYNFIIDKFGRIFEARVGSIAGPVRGSATGGNQGYSQLCCFLGDFAVEPPTPEAQESMISLLTWLADRYQVPVGSGQKVEFNSLGSNRWSAGTPIALDPISAHRDVSQTTCPGDACIELVRVDFPVAVSERLTPPTTTPPTTAVPTTAVPTTTTRFTSSTAALDSAVTPEPSVPKVSVSTTPSGSDETDAERAAGSDSLVVGAGGFPLVGTAAAALAAAGLGAVVVATKRKAGEPSPDEAPKS